MTYKETNKKIIDQTMHLIMNDTEDSIDSIDYTIGVLGRIILRKSPHKKGTPANEWNIRMSMPDYIVSIYFDSYTAVDDDGDLLLQFKNKGAFVGSIALSKNCKLAVIA